MEEDNNVEPGDLGPNETRLRSCAADAGELASIIAGLSIGSPPVLMDLITQEQTKLMDLITQEQTKPMDEESPIQRKGKREREEVSKEQKNKKRNISRNDRRPNELRCGPNGEPCDVSPEPSIDEN